MKFGGTSVEDTQAFARVSRIVRTHKATGTVVVVSAMSRVTDALLASVKRAAEGNVSAALGLVDEQLVRYLRVAESLLSTDARAEVELVIKRTQEEIFRLLNSVSPLTIPDARLTDSIVSHGEQLAANLLAAVLREEGLAGIHVDARRCIVTDADHGRGAPIMDETAKRTRAELEPLIQASKVPVLGGFIASARNGDTTTLGRGGSDYTAALVGAAVHAREIQIWTDVSGVLTADPRVVSGARTISRLSYSEAAELAYFGAKVLHPKTIQPAIEQRIPVVISNSRSPEAPGTIVCFETGATPRTVKAIAHKRGVTTVQVTSARMLGAYGFLRALFEIFDRHRTAVDVVTTSEVSVSLSLDDASALPGILDELRNLGTVEVEKQRAIICIVGEGLRSTPGIAARVFGTISDINVSLISQGASRINLTFVVDEQRVDEAVGRLHRALFEESEGFGAQSELVVSTLNASA